MNVRVVVAYVVGLLGCAALGYGVHGVISAGSCTAEVACAASESAKFVPFLPAGIVVSMVAAFLGARFAFAGMFLAVGVGALTAESDRAFPLVFGGIFTVVGLFALVGLAGAGRLAARRTEHALNLVETGIPAIATVVVVRDTGVRINDRPRVRVRVRLEPDGAAPLEAEKTVTMSPVQPIMVGQRFPAVFNPARPDDFGLITEISDPSRIPAKLVPFVQRLSAPPASPPASLPDELAKLDALHRSGVLSAAEFDAAKHRLLKS